MPRKAPTVEEYHANAQANGYERGAYREKDRYRVKTEYKEKVMTEQDKILRRYIMLEVLCLGSLRLSMLILVTRWQLPELQRDFIAKGLQPPDEAPAVKHYLGNGVEAPDLATVKDFFRFYVATSRGRIVDKVTVKSVKSEAEKFFAGFTRRTGTATDDADRSDVFNVSDH